jgi:hypothetical protein
VKPFSLEELLSSTPATIGAIPWLSAQGWAVDRIAQYSNGVITVDGGTPHNLALGEQVYLSGTNNMDGFYKVMPHPSESADKTRGFAIQGVLPANFQAIDQLKVYSLKEWPVYNTDKLSYSQSLELDQIQLERRKLNQRRDEFKAREQALSLRNAELITKIPDMEGLQGRLEQDYNALPMADALKSMQALLADLDVDLLEQLQQMRTDAANLSLDIDRHTLETAQPLLALQCREIEILCKMPEGHILLLSGSGDFQVKVNKIYQYLGEALQESNASQGDPAEVVDDSEEAIAGKSENESPSSSTPSPRSRRTGTAGMK